MINTVRKGIDELKRQGHSSAEALAYEFGDVNDDPGPGATPDTIRPQFTKLVDLAERVADALEGR
jgi:hypothetical protein